MLVWFRRDLRVEDNTALAHASRDAKRGVVAVFLCTPRQWRKHDGSFIRTYVPEQADVDDDHLHDPSTIPAKDRAKLKYPEPLIERAAVRERVFAAFNGV